MAEQMAEHDFPALVRAALGGEAPAALLDGGLRFVRVNEGWQRFAEANGGRRDDPSWAVGASYLDGIASPLREQVELALAGAMASRAPWHHDYECSSPQLERWFRLTAYPSGRPGDGLLLVHTLRMERPHTDREPVDAYRDEHGIVHLCMHCQRTQRTDHHGWDWVPDAVAAPGGSHGICEPCCAYYFGVVLDG